MKEGKYYTKSLAQNHVCAKFNMQEIWKKKPAETISQMCEFIASLEEITTK